MINILIADRDFLIKEGMKSILFSREDMKILAQASNSTEVFCLLRRNQPCVLIMDYDQPGAFELDDLVRIRRKHPEVKVLVISNNQRKHEVLTAIELGVNSYLLKECGEDEIIEAIHATANGEKFFCAKILENILQKQSLKDCEGLFLTTRELEIVKLVAEGHTTQQISEMLCRSIHTINTHRKHIMNKLGFNQPSELVLYAVKRGLVAA